MNAIMSHDTCALPHAVVDRAAVQAAMETGVLAVEKRNSFPIIGNVRLTGDGNTLFVTTTDLDMEIVTAIPAAADAGFDLTVSAHLFRDLLKKAPDAEFIAISQPEAVEIKGSDAFEDKTDIEFDTVNYSIAAIHPADFPELKGPSHNEARHFTLPGSDIAAALNAVAFAISTEETRYYLNGVCMTIRGGELVFVSTDGHRLSKQVLDVPEGAEGMPEVILPRKLVSTLLKLWRGKSAPSTVAVSVAERAVRFQFGDVTVTSKAIDGSFPDFERVTPKNNDKPITVSVSAMQEALKAVAVIASERGGKAVKFEVAGSELTLSVNNHENGTATTAIPAEIGFDDDFEIGFNLRYVNDFLANIKPDSDAVTITIKDAGSPALLTCDRDGWLGVLMPMRI